MWLFEELAIKGAVIGYLAGFGCGVLCYRRRLIRLIKQSSERLADADADGLAHCTTCHGSGFSGRGSGYGDVCGECGGLRYFPREKR